MTKHPRPKFFEKDDIPKGMRDRFQIIEKEFSLIMQKHAIKWDAPTQGFILHMMGEKLIYAAMQFAEANNINHLHILECSIFNLRELAKTLGKQEEKAAH